MRLHRLCPSRWLEEEDSVLVVFRSFVNRFGRIYPNLLNIFRDIRYGSAYLVNAVLRGWIRLVRTQVGAHACMVVGLWPRSPRLQCVAPRREWDPRASTISLSRNATLLATNEERSSMDALPHLSPVSQCGFNLGCRTAGLKENLLQC